MSVPEHSPLPWRMDNQPRDNVMIRAADNSIVAYMCEENMPRCYANATLIIAATAIADDRATLLKKEALVELLGDATQVARENIKLSASRAKLIAAAKQAVSAVDTLRESAGLNFDLAELRAAIAAVDEEPEA